MTDGSGAAKIVPSKVRRISLSNGSPARDHGRGSRIRAAAGNREVSSGLLTKSGPSLTSFDAQDAFNGAHLASTAASSR